MILRQDAMDELLSALGQPDLFRQAGQGTITGLPAVEARLFLTSWLK